MITCVRWVQSGMRISSTSKDKTANVLDLVSGRVIYIDKNEDESKLSIIDLIIYLFIRFCLLNMFPLKKAVKRCDSEDPKTI